MMYRNGDEYKINDMNQAHGISGQFDANTLRYPWKHTFFSHMKSIDGHRFQFASNQRECILFWST